MTSLESTGTHPPGSAFSAVRQRIPRDPSVLAGVRGTMRETLHGWGLKAEAEDVVLILDELLVNALIHGAGEITFLLAFNQATGGLRGEVTDEDPRSPVQLEPGVDRQDGRGMLLVKHLAQTWGWQATEEGKVVWFTYGTIPDLNRPVTQVEPEHPGQNKGLGR
jgi:anti-sigma regulatory factor (Ser/Thr protein kinase)